MSTSYLLNEMTDAELDAVLGADGVFNTLTHECQMNSFQFVLTCCGN